MAIARDAARQPDGHVGSALINGHLSCGLPSSTSQATRALCTSRRRQASALAAYTSLPNLHSALVHFPIALLTAALVLDIATLLVRRRWWTDPAAAALYAAGAIGAGAAYLAGEAAEDSLTGVSPPAQLALAAHADWALRTLLWFATLAVARLLVALYDRGSDDIRMRWARIGLLLGGLVGQYLLFQTADHGGALVYRHGLAVAAPASTPPDPAPDAAASAPGAPR